MDDSHPHWGVWTPPTWEAKKEAAALLAKQRQVWQRALANKAMQVCKTRCKPTAPDCLKEDENGLPSKSEPCKLIALDEWDCSMHWKVSLSDRSTHQ